MVDGERYQDSQIKIDYGRVNHRRVNSYFVTAAITTGNEAIIDVKVQYMKINLDMVSIYIK